MMAVWTGLFVLSVMVSWASGEVGNSLHDPNGDGFVSTLLDQRQYPESDGTFGFRYETENGITNRMAGKTGPNGGTIMAGEYSYIQPDGSTVRVRWTADENGYHPVVTISGATQNKVIRKRSHPVQPAVRRTSRVSSRGRHQLLALQAPYR